MARDQNVNKPVHDWVENQEMRQKIIDAWDDYLSDRQIHKLYKYLGLIDDAWYELNPEDFKPWRGADQQPSLKDMW